MLSVSPKTLCSQSFMCQRVSCVRVAMKRDIFYFVFKEQNLGISRKIYIFGYSVFCRISKIYLKILLIKSTAFR